MNWRTNKRQIACAQFVIVTRQVLEIVSAQILEGDQSRFKSICVDFHFIINVFIVAAAAGFENFRPVFDMLHALLVIERADPSGGCLRWLARGSFEEDILVASAEFIEELKLVEESPVSVSFDLAGV